MQNKYYVIILLVFGLIFGVYVWFNVERFEEVVTGPWSEEALKNPYLAAERFLKNKNIDAESSTQLLPLDEISTNSLLIIKNANLVLNKSRVDTLEQWMQAGGHVVVAAQLFDDGNSDVLLERFEITKYSEFYDNDDDSQPEIDQELEDIEDDIRKALEEPSSDESISSDGESFSDRLREFTEQQQKMAERQELEKTAAAQGLDVAETLRRKEATLIGKNILRIDLGGLEYKVRADFTGSGSLYHPYLYWDEDEEYEGYKPFYWEENDIAVGFMQMHVGEGLLTVLADLNIWNSQQIAFLDHAMLLELMAEDADKVWFLYGANVPSLLELIWRNFSELCIALLVFLVFYFIYSSRRFGAIRDDIELNRRAFKEHVYAVGDFFWRQKKSDSLLKSVREDIWMCMRKRYSGFDQYKQDKKIEILVELTEMSDTYLQSLMFGDIPHDEIRFFHAVKTLQKIRKML